MVSLGMTALFQNWRFDKMTFFLKKKSLSRRLSPRTVLDTLFAGSLNKDFFSKKNGFLQKSTDSEGWFFLGNPFRVLRIEYMARESKWCL